ncbi:MAG: HD domain-containing protein [Lachnospiraceae bacterium]|nr:HD domain-containing protein [Lachnospiraceae bacterium]
MIESHGHEAYAVGGCVRDCILGKTPNDWDITTSARPKEIKAYFNRTIDTGIEHGTVTVRMRGESFEVTTYRIDGDYEDGRHPKEVTFTGKLSDDLLRRDFTVNAMAYHPVKGLVDIFGGYDDLNGKVIRAVGDPTARFTEDALRMLRAIRFAAKLDFTIEEATYDAVRKMSANLAKISRERIQAEIVKLLLSDHPERMRDVYRTGLSASFFPEWDALFATPQHSVHHCFDVGEHTIAVLCALPPERILRLAGVFHDIAKPLTRRTDAKGRDHFVGHPQLGAQMTKDILRRMKFDNATIDTVSALVKYHDERPAPTKRNMRRLAARIGSDRMEALFTLKEADIVGQSDHEREEKLQSVKKMREEYLSVVSEGEAVRISDLAINGKDLLDAGIPQGREIGEILKLLLKKVVDTPEENNRTYLLEQAWLYHELKR